MKKVLAVSVDEEIIDRISQEAVKRSFRNKSHLVEEAIKNFLETEDA